MNTFDDEFNEPLEERAEPECDDELLARIDAIFAEGRETYDGDWC